MNRFYIKRPSFSKLYGKPKESKEPKPDQEKVPCVKAPEIRKITPLVPKKVCELSPPPKKACERPIPEEKPDDEEECQEESEEECEEEEEEPSEEESDKVEDAVPTYENELDIYKKDLLGRLSAFRKARSVWRSQAKATDNTLVSQQSSTIEVDRYAGRCLPLRKIGLKTQRLYTHYRSLRPLQYYTLNRRIICDIEENEDRGTELIQGGTVKLTASERKLEKKRRKEEKKKAQQDKKDMAKREIVRKLRAATRGQNELLPCKCETGKEITFIIKGLCLCDNKALNKLGHTSKYCGVIDGKPKPEGVVGPTVNDSLELYRRSLHEIHRRESSGLVSIARSKSVEFSDIVDVDKSKASLSDTEIPKEVEPMPERPIAHTTEIKKCPKVEETLVRVVDSASEIKIHHQPTAKADSDCDLKPEPESDSETKFKRKPDAKSKPEDGEAKPEPNMKSTSEPSTAPKTESTKESKAESKQKAISIDTTNETKLEGETSGEDMKKLESEKTRINILNPRKSHLEISRSSVGFKEVPEVIKTPEDDNPVVNSGEGGTRPSTSQGPPSSTDKIVRSEVHGDKSSGEPVPGPSNVGKDKIASKKSSSLIVIYKNPKKKADSKLALTIDQKRSLKNPII